MIGYQLSMRLGGELLTLELKFVLNDEETNILYPLLSHSKSQKCDGFMVASTKTDKKLGTVFIPHEGPEEYNNIWQKVRAMWSYIYDNYYEKVSVTIRIAWLFLLDTFFISFFVVVAPV